MGLEKQTLVMQSLMISNRYELILEIKAGNSLLHNQEFSELTSI